MAKLEGGVMIERWRRTSGRNCQQKKIKMVYQNTRICLLEVAESPMTEDRMALKTAAC